MKKYRSLHQELMEGLEGKIRVISGEDNYALISELNKEMATSIYEEKVKEPEEELEIADLLINA